MKRFLLCLLPLFLCAMEEWPTQIVELHGIPKAFATDFLHNTRLDCVTLVGEYRKSLGIMNSERLLQKEWSWFAQTLAVEANLKEIVNVTQLQDLQEIYLNPYQKPQFFEKPYSFVNGKNLLLLSLFILQNEELALLKKVAAKYNLLKQEVITIPAMELNNSVKKKKSSCLLQ